MKLIPFLPPSLPPSLPPFLLSFLIQGHFFIAFREKKGEVKGEGENTDVREKH